MVTSRFRGHKIENTENGWVFCKSRKPVEENVACGNCGAHSTPDGYDSCIGELPGLMNACCGHGQTGEAYVQFWNGSIVAGASAKVIMEELKNGGQ